MLLHKPQVFQALLLQSSSIVMALEVSLPIFGFLTILVSLTALGQEVAIPNGTDPRSNSQSDTETHAEPRRQAEQSQSTSSENPERLRPVGQQKPMSGIQFNCPPDFIKDIKKDMVSLLKEFNWTLGKEVLFYESGNVINYKLNSDLNDTDTLNMRTNHPELKIKDEIFTYKKNGIITKFPLVSTKEILAALLQNGRLTEFKGDACSIEKLTDHLAIRQNITFWGSRISTSFPGGGSLSENATWNPEVWSKTLRLNPTTNKLDELRYRPKPGILPHEAVHDIFRGKNKYLLGCTDACQFVTIQGIMNYFVKKGDAGALNNINDTAGTYPTEFPIEYPDKLKPGKYLINLRNIPYNNWVPGDWGYIRNSDDLVRKNEPDMNGRRHKNWIGKEGFNIIYNSNGKFITYYPGPDRTLKECAQHVIGWFESQEAIDRYPSYLEAVQDKNFLRDVRDVPQLVFDPLPPEFLEKQELEATAGGAPNTSPNSPSNSPSNPSGMTVSP